MANSEDEEIEEEQEEQKEEERIEEQEQVGEERVEEKEQVEEERVEEQEQVGEERVEEKEQVEEERVEEKEQVETVSDNNENTQVQADYQQLNESQNLLKEKDNEIQELTAKNIDSENQLSLLKNQIQQLESQKSQPVPAPKPAEEPFNQLEPPPDIIEIPTPSSESSAPSAPSGKFICPKCNSSRVVEEKDKSKVLYMAAGGPIYAKKQRCLKCSNIWTAEL